VTHRSEANLNGAEAVATPRGHGETILVVEDDATARSIISDALQDLGYNILTASDARFAIPLLQSTEAIELLISDVILPHVNGRKLVEMARVSRPTLKTKPFALDTLGAKVRAMIER